MKNILSLILLSASLISCTAEELQPAPVKSVVSSKTIEADQINTFTVIWDSNQEGATVEVKKYVFKDCKVVSTDIKTYSEKTFDIVLENGQKFDIQILHEEPRKNPELYLSIYKGRELQYEQEVNTNGFMFISFVDCNGNIAE